MLGRPDNLTLSPADTTLIDGDLLSVSGTFTDPDINDPHMVLIGWSDRATVANDVFRLDRDEGFRYKEMDNLIEERGLK